MWLLFPLLAVVILVIFLALPVQAGLGYLTVIIWIAFMLYLVFYHKDPVAQALQKIDRRR